VDGSTTGAPITVHEGVDGLELGMDDGGLCDRRKVVRSTKCAEISHEIRHKLVRRRDEVRWARVVVAATNPVLLCPKVPAVLLQLGTSEQAAMQLQKQVWSKGLTSSYALDRENHGIDIVEDFVGSDVWLLPRDRPGDFSVK
jgi:hypothetical protein